MPPKAAKKKTKVEKKPPIVTGNEFSTVLSSDEIVSLVQILTFAKQVFDQMTATAVKDKNDVEAAIWGARSKLTSMLYAKFRDVADIGEPTSRQIH